MRSLFVYSSLVFVLLCSPAGAQCFNRMSCDANKIEVRSQFSVTIPLGDVTNGDDAIKAMQDARRQLAAFSDHEFESIKSTYGKDAMLKSTSSNSNLSDGGFRGRNVFVSIMNTYEVSKPK